MAELNFQLPLLQSSVSHDPLEIIFICWFGAQEIYNLLLLSMLKTVVLQNISFFLIINIFDVTFKASMLNYYIVLFPKLFNSSA